MSNSNIFEERQVPATKVWKTWKTIKLDTGLKSASDFRRAYKNAGMKIGDCANDILGKPALVVAESEMKVELCSATVHELTGKDKAPLSEIFDRIKEVGDLCPPELGPQLCLQHTDQPKGEWLVVAMEPITDSDGYLLLFYVERDGDECCLNASDGDLDRVWGGNDRFVFLRRR